jgi:adenosine deaminase
MVAISIPLLWYELSQSITFLRVGPSGRTSPLRWAAMDARALRRFVEVMPKTELHLHLDGSVRVGTAIELAASRGIDAPADWQGMYDALVAPERCSSQAELLRAFDLPIALLQDADALERVTAELVETKAADNVRYVEIRWGPLLHLRRGLSLEAGIEAVCRGAAAASNRTGTVVRLIATALRSHEPSANVDLAAAAARYAGDGLVAFDLAGPEEAYPDPAIHRRAFEVARSAGLRITIHAGEWGGADQVRRALDVDPERIAHGPGAIDDPALVRALIERGVTLDLGPTSNVQAGIVPSLKDHPLGRLHRAGVTVTLSTDDLTVSDISLSDEYGRAVAEIGLSAPELWAINLAGIAAGFAEPAVLAGLRSEFERWAAPFRELREAT